MPSLQYLLETCGFWGTTGHFFLIFQLMITVVTRAQCTSYISGLNVWPYEYFMGHLGAHGGLQMAYGPLL